MNPLQRKKRMRRLLERDGPACCICTEPIDFLVVGKATGLHPRAPSIEHKRMRFLGGTNRQQNLALAHRRCNIESGNLWLWTLRWSERAGDRNWPIMPAFPALLDPSIGYD